MCKISFRKRMTRRGFLRSLAALTSLTVLGPAAQCGPTPTPDIVEKVVTQIVEKPLEKVVTQIIEKPVEVTRIVEKKVVETKIVEKVVQPTPNAEPPPGPPERILLVGNVWLTFNGGLDSHLAALAASADPTPTLETGRVTVHGKGTLANHVKFSSIADKIRERSWQVVVLQESAGTSVNFEEKFHEAAKQLDAEIKEAGARTVFLMFPGLERPSNLTTENQTTAYNKIGGELGATVAPVGLAWQQSLIERPTLRLIPELSSSEAYPIPIHSTYLTACVLYATLLGQNPVGLTYGPGGITDDEREFLQRIAWDTVQDYKQPALAFGSRPGLSLSSYQQATLGRKEVILSNGR
jgi:hypothetical protein